MRDSVTTDRKQQDFDDLQREMAGLDVGRQQRFLPEGEERGNNRGSDKRALGRDALSALAQRLMNDTAYAALYSDTMQQLEAAERAAALAMEARETYLAEQLTAFETMKDNAARLPDGRLVFRDKDGEVVDENGAQITDLEAQSIVWPDNAPTYEEYVAQRERVDAARRDIEDIREYQVDVLGNARNRMEDERKPVDEGEMEQIQSNIRDRAPASMQTEIETSAAPITEPTATSSAASPAL